MSLKADLKAFLIDWNNKYPIDFWWRKKYNIPFGSEAHLKANFLDMYADFLEEKMMNEFIKKDDKKADEEFDLANPGAVKKVIKMSSEEIDNEFDNINLADFSTPSNT